MNVRSSTSVNHFAGSINHSIAKTTTHTPYYSFNTSHRSSAHVMCTVCTYGAPTGQRVRDDRPHEATRGLFPSLSHLIHNRHLFYPFRLARYDRENVYWPPAANNSSAAWRLQHRSANRHFTRFDSFYFFLFFNNTTSQIYTVLRK